MTLLSSDLCQNTKKLVFFPSLRYFHEFKFFLQFKLKVEKNLKNQDTFLCKHNFDWESSSQMAKKKQNEQKKKKKPFESKNKTVTLSSYYSCFLQLYYLTKHFVTLSVLKLSHQNLSRNIVLCSWYENQVCTSIFFEAKINKIDRIIHFFFH